MARPNKIGLEYFPLDVDFFNDEKIGAISGEFGIKGELACIKLLCAIYRQGYFILWNEMLQMKLIKELPGVSADLLNNIVSRLVRWGFFDKTLFDKNGILTSSGIQRRYFEIIKRRRTNDDNLPYLLVNVCNNSINVCNNYHLTDINVYNNRQSKVKESKVKKITPPLPSPKDDSVGVVPTWRNDFEIYLNNLREAYKRLLANKDYIEERERYHPGIDIKLSLEKACKDFWSKESGWNNKKKSKTVEIDWETTFNNALDLKSNQVWKTKEQLKNEKAQTVKYRKL